MPVRSVIRPGLPGRLRNPYYAVPNTAPSPQAPPATQYQQQARAPSGVPTTGLEGHFVSNGLSDVHTPYGTVTLIFANGVPTIKNNVIFAMPEDMSSASSFGKFTSQGAMLYTYSVHDNRLLPVPVGGSGGVYYQNPSAEAQYAQGQQAYNIGISDINTAKMLTAQIQSTAKNPNANYQNLSMMTQERNQMLYPTFNSNSPFAGYSARGLVEWGKTWMQQNAPVEIAKYTAQGLQPIKTTVTDPIYGNVSGRNQLLGALVLKPQVINNTITLMPTGFEPSVVQVSGPGWSAGVKTSYNPATGQISINPKNYTYVAANLETTTMPAGEVIKSITMPSGFGLSQQYGAGKLNYINITNIPVANGQSTAYESYTQQGGIGKYFLINPGTFPYSISESVNLGKGITEKELSIRQFNSLTGAISYSTSSAFAIPGLSSVAVPTGASLFTQIYTYKGQKYTFTFNPSLNKYTIAPTPANPTLSLQSLSNFFGNYISSAPQVNYILSSSMPAVTGYNLTSPTGAFLGGANYLNAKTIGIGNSSSSTSTIGLPWTPALASYYSQAQTAQENSYISQQLAGQKAQFQKTLQDLGPGFSSVAFVTKYYNPLLGAYQAGELQGSGHMEQGLMLFGKSLAEGEAPVFAVAAPVTATTGAGISVLSNTALNILTGKPIQNNIVSAASYGAVSGGILGFFAPEGSTAAQAARFAAEKTIQTGVLYGAITGIGGVVELALGGTASPSTGKTNIPIQQASINQGSTAQSQSSFSLLGNYTPSKYLNIAVNSFASGALTGTEYAGEFYVVGVTAAGLTRSMSPIARAVGAIATNKYTMGALAGGITSAGILATGGTLRQAGVGGMVAGIAVFGMGAMEGKPATNVKVIPETADIYYKPELTDFKSVIPTATEQTGLDTLNYFHAEPVEYLKNIPDNIGVTTTEDYQLAGNKYAINPAALDQPKAYLNAASDYYSRLIPTESRIALGGATNELALSSEEGQSSTITSLGRIRGELEIPQGVKYINNVAVKNVLGVRIDYLSSTPAASTDLATATAPGEASYKSYLISKPTLIDRLFNGVDVKVTYLGAGTAPTSSAFVTGIDEGFTGRAVDVKDGIYNLDSYSSSVFYGRNPETTEFGKMYSGKIISNDQIIAGHFTELNTEVDALRTLGFDDVLGSKPVEPQEQVMPHQYSPWPGTEVDVAKPVASGVAADLAPGTSARPGAPLEAATKSIVMSSVVPAPPMFASIDISPAASPIALASGVGFDPAVVLGRATLPAQATVMSLQLNSRSLPGTAYKVNEVSSVASALTSKTTSLGLQLYNLNTKVSNQSLTKLQNLSALTSKTTSLFKNAIATKTALKTNTLQLQKTLQKSQTQTQTALYSSVGIGAFTGVGFKVPWVIAPPKKYPTKKTSHAHTSSKPTIFGYLPDVTSSLLSIHGKKSRKKAYQSVGLSRPII